MFDVDIQEGAPPLKLPYNASENPFQAAQRFIEQNEIPQDYLEQIANFIVQNAGGVTIGAEAPSSAYSDPFTGAGRYVPGESAATAQPAGPKVIPMTEYAFVKAANLKAIQTKLGQLNAELAKSAVFLR